MLRRYMPWMAALVCGALLSGEAAAQDLQELVDRRAREEEELRKIPDQDIPGIGTGRLGRMRLPQGEEVESLSISQDAEIDPDTYIVGPGDVLQLYIWGEFDQAIRVRVSPEGHAMVATIGSFDVSNRTLTDVKTEIIAAAEGEKYPGVDVSLTLESMRFFNVYLTGAVLSEGVHIIHPITRVADLIERGGGFLDEIHGTIEETVAGKKVTRTRQLQPQPTARRSIRLTHRDGSVELIDLAMFLATGDLSFNPYLRMGDVVHVPYRTRDIHIYGSVNEEGAQEFRDGDTVGDLVTLAGGISGSAPLEKAEIWRFRSDGVTTDIISLLQDRALGNSVTLDDIAHVALQSKDMIFVRGRSDWQQTPTVHAHGEIKYRGRYRIELGKTGLREFIDHAGGFTENASLAEARVIRASFRAQRDPEYERLRAVAAVSGLADMSPSDKAYLKTKGTEERGRLVVDFERLFLEGDESQNIILEGADVVFVPKQRRTVSLSGQLKKPGLVDFQEGRRVAYYLEQSGGYAFNADKRGGRLIRARTGQREKLKKNLIVEQGDEIWIPEKQYRDVWGFVQATMRSVAEGLTLILLVRAI